MVSNDIFQSLCALSSPTCLTYSSMPSSKPLIACPPLRPEAPNPTLAPSKTMTFFPFSASSNAADKPKNPAPITHTSACSI